MFKGASEVIDSIVAKSCNECCLHILESHDLVLHQRDEGGHHYHHLAPEHCGVLVAQALAKTYATNMHNIM